jgi:hypothetical protein
MAAIAGVPGTPAWPIPGTPAITGTPTQPRSATVPSTAMSPPWPFPGTPAIPGSINTYAQASTAQTAEIKSLKAELVLLRKDMAAAQTATVIPLKSLDDRTKKWDLDGLPAPRDDGTASTVVLMRAS